MKLSELEQNILALQWMQEDYGHLTDIAIDKILETIQKLKTRDLQTALTLSEVFKEEPFWEKTKETAYQNYLELLEE